MLIWTIFDHCGKTGDTMQLYHAMFYTQIDIEALQHELVRLWQ